MQNLTINMTCIQAEDLADALRAAADSSRYDPTDSQNVVSIFVNPVLNELHISTPFGAFNDESRCEEVEFDEDRD